MTGSNFQALRVLLQNIPNKNRAIFEFVAIDLKWLPHCHVVSYVKVRTTIE